MLMYCNIRPQYRTEIQSISETVPCPHMVMKRRTGMSTVGSRLDPGQAANKTIQESTECDSIAHHDTMANRCIAKINQGR